MGGGTMKYKLKKTTFKRQTFTARPHIQKEKRFLHFSFKSGANPYFYRGTSLRCFLELQKWKKAYKIKLIKPGFYLLSEVTPSYVNLFAGL